MRAEKGVPEEPKENNKHSCYEGAPEIVSVKNTSSAGESAKRRCCSGLLSEETSADNDDGEDD